MFQAPRDMKVPLIRLAYAVVFLAAVTYAFFAFPKGMRAWQDKQRQIQELEKRNAAMAKAVERKKEHIGRLTDSPAEQELEIRKRLKLAHPDEKIFILGEPETGAVSKD